MTIIDTLITDRSQSDVSRITYLNGLVFADMSDAEKAEWLAGSKGAYNYTDLNRVGLALEYLAEALTTETYPVAVNVKTNWQVSDYIYLPDIEHYLSQIEVIRSVLSVWNSTPATPTTILNITQANDIEKILVDVEKLLNNMITAYSYRICGTFYLGEAI